MIDTTTYSSWPDLGCGVGLRNEHYDDILSHFPEMDWFEAISENFMDSAGRPLHILEQIRSHYPVGLHGVALSIGSTDPLNPKYLRNLRTLCDRIEPLIVSDHLCWSGVDGANLHDLLPLPFTQEAVEHVAGRVQQVQDYLKRPVLLENVSTYITFKHSEMSEWEFMCEIVKRSGCGILLDINNVFVNATNHGFDPLDYLSGLPAAAVGQFHLAGNQNMGKFLFDTHGMPVMDEVWNLYRVAVQKFGPTSTLIEWDENIPKFQRLSEEAAKARAIRQELLRQPTGNRHE